MNIELVSRTPLHPRDTAPLLFVHGVCHAAWCWAEHYLDFFAERGYSAYALSLRGHGGSDGHETLRWHRLGDYVDDVRQAVRSLPQPPILIGHSMGGGVVQKYLETYTAPAAVLLASMPPQGVFATALRTARAHPWSFLWSLSRLRLLPLFDTPARTRWAFFSEDMPDGDVERYQARLQEESFAAFLDILMLDRPNPRRMQRLPMLVVAAERDRLFSVRQLRKTAQTYGADFLIASGMAHDVMLERHWRVPAQHIAAWLGRLHPH